MAQVSYAPTTYVLFSKGIYKLWKNFICDNILSQVVTVICKATEGEGCRLLNTRHLCTFENR